MKYKLLLILVAVILTGCFPYVYHDQNQVLIKDVDIDGTLKIAKIELDECGFDSVLTVWAMRDQIINQEQAKLLSEYYFSYIEVLGSDKDKTIAEFSVWHFAWAISNYYRNGSSEIRSVMENAYQDAKKRPGTLKKFKAIADEHINGDKIYMGDIHGLGRSYAHAHIIVPGNKDYIQSFDEYKNKKQDDLEKKYQKMY